MARTQNVYYAKWIRDLIAIYSKHSIQIKTYYGENKTWLKPGLIVFLIIFLFTVCLGILCHFTDLLNDYWQGVAVEMVGVTMEIFLVVIILGIFEHKQKQQNRIEHLRRQIDDYKDVDNELAKATIGSALQELASYGVTDIDFSGWKVKDFSFFDIDISSLKESKFSNGFSHRNNFSKLVNVDFSVVDCEAVQFGIGKLSFAEFENCSFHCSRLCKANFTNSELVWDEDQVKADPADWEEIERDENLKEIDIIPIYKPAFSGADLRGAVFDRCLLHNADFREAENINEASFIGTEGLDTCYFDKGIILKTT